jgi:hypothetical protein
MACAGSGAIIRSHHLSDYKVQMRSEEIRRMAVSGQLDRANLLINSRLSSFPVGSFYAKPTNSELVAPITHSTFALILEN